MRSYSNTKSSNWQIGLNDFLRKIFIFIRFWGQKCPKCAQNEFFKIYEESEHGILLSEVTVL